MRKILIALVLLLSGCQTTNQSSSSVSAANKHAAKNNRQSQNNKIYDRYKNQGNRYTQSRDGAPKKQGFLNFKEAKPTKEPLSRYGNPVEYKVDGTKYQVMRNTTRYKARGIASWYGTKFHKQRTSSGEPYDMYVMSAAHKTLPLPTYVRVKNLNNGKVAVVRVNDRGPFHSNRIIDLSYAAALKLGVFPKGTAPVEVEALAGPAGQAKYYIQAGAFSSSALANQFKAKLARVSHSPIIIEQYKNHYIVRIGPFANKRVADSLQKKLISNGIKGSFSVLI